MNQELRLPPATGAPVAVALTPAGLQPVATVRNRRLVMAVLNIGTYAGLLGWLGWILAAGGWSVVDAVMFAAAAIAAPWTVLGFWNAAIGLWLLHGSTRPLAEVAPFAEAVQREGPLLLRTAVLMTLRNEDPVRALARMRIVQASLEATGFGDRFSYFVLSDTSDPAIAAAEEAEIAAWEAAAGPSRLIAYRRRRSNDGFKAGNIHDFCCYWGDDHDLMLPLDADSLMAGGTIVAMVRMMQAYPRIGILQSLIVGTPAKSGFARLFQFGMRHGMRPYTVGSAWWNADCGPYWGHNALVRIRPFRDACALPPLPGRPPLGGHILSHDQVEAVLMRRAGYEVRVLPVETGSWEDNPPSLPEFVRRDLRWCLGNLQYLRLLRIPGLEPTSRFQLAWAIIMFVGLPAWPLTLALLPFLAAEAKATAAYPTGAAATLFVTFLAMHVSPKIAGMINTALTRGGTRRYGGPLRFAASAALELIFSFLQGAISMFRTTVFMARLLGGRVRLGWNGQARDVRRLPWLSATREFWPASLFGAAITVALAVVAPVALLWVVPLLTGYVVAIPFAVITADPAFGAALRRWRLCVSPEELAPPPEIAALMAVR
jgi:membrane glycosyltransferase